MARAAKLQESKLLGTRRDLPVGGLPRNPVRGERHCAERVLEFLATIQAHLVGVSRDGEWTAGIEVPATKYDIQESQRRVYQSFPHIRFP